MLPECVAPLLRSKSLSGKCANLHSVCLSGKYAKLSEAELPGRWVLLQCGIDPRTSGRMDCDVIDVNSTSDESAKENFYFHVHGSHL